MGYVVAAYGVTIISLVAYGVHLVRERARLLEGNESKHSS